MNNIKLSVVIPTYNRPTKVIDFIDHISHFGNRSQFQVIVSSNGYEPDLKRCIERQENTIYHYFEENVGAIRNIKHLIGLCDTDFLLLLSDEDRISESGIDELLNTLEHNYVDVVVSNIINEDGSDYNKYPECCLSLYKQAKGFREVFFWDLTYLSGICIRKKSINFPLDDIFENRLENVYPHIRLINKVLEHGALKISGIDLIIKGEEAGSGGDSHSHSGTGLNPAIYSYDARVMQYRYYLDRLYIYNKNRKIQDKENMEYTWMIMLDSAFGKSNEKLHEFPFSLLGKRNGSQSRWLFNLYIFYMKAKKTYKMARFFGIKWMFYHVFNKFS